MRQYQFNPRGQPDAGAGRDISGSAQKGRMAEYRFCAESKRTWPRRRGGTIDRSTSADGPQTLLTPGAVRRKRTSRARLWKWRPAA